MNLFRRKPFILGWSHVHIQKQQFAAIKGRILERIKMIQSPQKYYNELMKEVDGDAKGFFHLDASYLLLMLEKCTTPEDIDAAVTAFYNFYGHRTKFSNADVDKVVQKAIECKNPKATHDILLNHNYLLYYPQPKVLDEMMKYYRENKLIEEAKAFFPRVVQRSLIKFNRGFFEQAIYLAKETQDYTFAFTAYKTAKRLGLRISNNAFQSVIDCVSELAAKGEKKNIKIANSIIEAANSYKLDAEDFLQLSLSRASKPENAVRVFESLSEAKLSLKEGENLIQNTEANQECFRKLYELVAGNRELYGRFTRAIKSFQQKYAERAFDKDLYALIQDLDKQANESSTNAEAPKAAETEGAKEDQNQPTA